MFDALEKNEIDGILMDKYKVGYYLEERSNNRFKMFDGFEANIPYFVAIRDSDPIKELTNEGACFTRRIEGQAVNELLISHLQPVTVRSIQRQIVTQFSDTPRYIIRRQKARTAEKENYICRNDWHVRGHVQFVTGSNGQIFYPLNEHPWLSTL